MVEDDPSISEPLLAGLARNGIDAHCVQFGALAVEALPGADMVILDLGLPDMDGLDVLRAIRKISDVPVIIATARGEKWTASLG